MTSVKECGKLNLSMANPVFLNKARRKWLARTLQGAFLIGSAAVVGEPFLKLSWVGRILLFGALIISFGLGLFFAKADAAKDQED